MKSSEKKLNIKKSSPPVIVAEVGVLTWGEKERGLRYVDLAAKAGIKFLKFQSFSADRVVRKEDDPFWHNRLKQRELSKDTYFEIQKYADKKGITTFATTHNEYDLVEYAKEGMPILKIGSGDSDNIRMIDMALSTGKPVLVSLGLMTEKESIKILERYKRYARQITFLHCVTAYPAPSFLAGLKILEHWAKLFPMYQFGYSDHTIGSGVACAAVALGAKVIEKHLCLPEDKVKPKFESLDIKVSLIPDEFIEFQRDVISAYEAVFGGKGVKTEKSNARWARKSVTMRIGIKAGEKIRMSHLEGKRPCDKVKGDIPVGRIYELGGRKTKRDMLAGEALRYRDIK